MVFLSKFPAIFWHFHSCHFKQNNLFQLTLWTLHTDIFKQMTCLYMLYFSGYHSNDSSASIYLFWMFRDEDQVLIFFSHVWTPSHIHPTSENHPIVTSCYEQELCPFLHKSSEHNVRLVSYNPNNICHFRLQIHVYTWEAVKTEKKNTNFVLGLSNTSAWLTDNTHTNTHTHQNMHYKHF